MIQRGTQTREYMQTGDIYPELQINAIRYRPTPEYEIMDGKMVFTNFDSIEPEISHEEEIGMNLALDQASLALEEGDLPVGATLILPEGGVFSQRTNDNIADNVRGHAEMRLLDIAEKYVGSDFSRCTLLSTIQLCATCTTEYAGANIGKVIYGVPRDYVKPLIGHMRIRHFNFPELMGDGNVSTTVISNYRAAGSLALLAAYGKKHQVQPQLEGLPDVVRVASEGKLLGDDYADTVQELYFGAQA